MDEAERVNQGVQQISAEEVRAAMNRMKTGKAVGPDNIPVEAWKCLGELAIYFLLDCSTKSSKMKECLMNEEVCQYQF